jgi:hypothetical protein
MFSCAVGGDGSYGVMPDWGGGIRGPAHGGMHGQPLPGLLGALGECTFTSGPSLNNMHGQLLPGLLGAPGECIGYAVVIRLSVVCTASFCTGGC